jgi:hypothetical protein
VSEQEFNLTLPADAVQTGTIVIATYMVEDAQGFVYEHQGLTPTEFLGTLAMTQNDFLTRKKKVSPEG